MDDDALFEKMFAKKKEQHDIVKTESETQGDMVRYFQWCDLITKYWSDVGDLYEKKHREWQKINNELKSWTKKGIVRNSTEYACIKLNLPYLLDEWSEDNGFWSLVSKERKRREDAKIKEALRDL